MTIQLAKAALLWSIGINLAFLLVWSIATFAAHDAIYGLSMHFFNVPAETFDAVNFACIVAYKIAVLFFNVVPFMALVLVTRSQAPRA
ncbi:MAG: DUF6868 family protein [Acidobacteriota bacterium]